MKKQFSIPVRGTFIALCLLFNISVFSQDFAVLDINKRVIKIPFREVAEFTLNGSWSVFNDYNLLDKIEIYDKNSLVGVKTDEEAHAFLKNSFIEKLELRALNDRIKLQTLYDDYDYVSDKKIILDNYKIVAMDLLFMAKEVDCFEKLEKIAAELKILDKNVSSLVYKNTRDLESQLKKCYDVKEIKCLLSR
jgi:hypothetical protein